MIGHAQSPVNRIALSGIFIEETRFTPMIPNDKSCLRRRDVNRNTAMFWT